MSAVIAVTARDSHTTLLPPRLLDLARPSPRTHSSQVANLSTTRACRILVSTVCLPVTFLAAAHTSFRVLGLASARHFLHVTAPTSIGCGDC